MESKLLLIVLVVGLVDHCVGQDGANNLLNTELHECLQLISRTNAPSNSTQAMESSDVEIQSTCLQEFVWKFGGIKWTDFNITEHDVKFINDLTHSLVHEHNRVKRQAGPIGGPQRIFPRTGFRIRREYRRLTDRDRFFFHEAVNILKRRGGYDTFANLHQGAVTASAHGGPNFFGWHRVYCALIEEALRRINRRVTLPYWDSSLDFEMDNPVNSIIWSPRFLGNGDGFVTTGPFANWDTPVGRLTRNIGGASRLISKEVIREIMTRCRTAEISSPTADAQYNLEFAHGGPHVWVGGQMSGLNTAAHDPTFFLHHAFIDYLWEVFRIQQSRRCGVNPTTDYPAGAAPPHERNRIMDGFPQYRNIDGYRGYWTMNWYRYEQSPRCSMFRPFCGSPYLRCNVQRRRCVSIARRRLPTEGTGRAGVMAFGAPSAGQANRARMQESSIPIGPRFMAPASDGRTQSAGFRGRRRRRAANQTSDAMNDFGKGFMAPPSDRRTSAALGYNIAKGVPSSDFMLPLSQNPGQTTVFPFATPMPLLPVPLYPTLEAGQFAQGAFPEPVREGHMPMVDDTIYIPVKIIYRRPRRDERHSCQIDTNGVIQIDVRARGLNYMGFHDDYVNIDAQPAVSTATVYMAVKLSANSTSEVLLTAIDGCGGMCQARCLDSKYPVRTFRDCNGVMQVDQNSTFGETVTGTVRAVLRDHNNAVVDTSRHSDIQFLCPQPGPVSGTFGQRPQNMAI